LTLVGVFGAVMTFGGYAASIFRHDWLWLAMLGFLVQWFGDSMDGSLARFRKIERPSFGYFIDHSCDGLACLLILGGLGLSPFVRLDAALFALVGYLLLSISAYLSVQAIGEMRSSYLSLGPTELRLILIGFTAAMLNLGPAGAVLGPLTPYDLIVASVGVVLVGLFVVQTCSVGRRLAATESSGTSSKP
jgi:phosphatidylglycerophosphate synthase